MAVGEGQALGNHLSFGGPYLGFFAFRREHVRRSSGRIAGETRGPDGRRGFVFTLSTREQHIRREKATSNICTNQSLNALAAAVYLACLGPRGLRQVAELCWHKAHYAASAHRRAARLLACDEAEFFHEFVVRCPVPGRRGSTRGFSRSTGSSAATTWRRTIPRLKNEMLLCCTELNTREEIDLLVTALWRIAAMPEPLLFEIPAPGGKGYRFPPAMCRRRRSRDLLPRAACPFPRSRRWTWCATTSGSPT